MRKEKSLTVGDIADCLRKIDPTMRLVSLANTTNPTFVIVSLPDQSGAESDDIVLQALDLYLDRGGSVESLLEWFGNNPK